MKNGWAGRNSRLFLDKREGGKMENLTKLQQLRAGILGAKQYTAKLFLTLAEAVEELAGKIKEESSYVDGETLVAGIRQTDAAVDGEILIL